MFKTAVLALVSIAPSSLFAAEGGVVFTLNNQASGNSVLSFDRGSDGQLQFAGQYSTGGLGLGKGLGSQGALSLSRDGRYLVAVNAGSNTISLFTRSGDTLGFDSQVGSGGVEPISVDQFGNLVYVVNEGDSFTPGNIQGYQRVGSQLLPLPGAAAVLSAPNVGPAQIKFTIDGRGVIVTEKGTNLIDTFQLDSLGRVLAHSFQTSSGLTPFGFDIDRRGRLFVSEAFGGATDSSALSSYDVGFDLTLHPLSASIGTGQTAACWTVVTGDDRFAYVTNTGSGSVTGYSVSPDGTLSLLNPDGVTGVTGGAPTDLAISGNGRFMYVLTGGTQSLVGFQIGSLGDLTLIENAGGLPKGTVGLVAR